jgi:prepilin peptidase CpaA
MPAQIIAVGLVLTWATTIAVVDYRKRLIPNALLLVAVLATIASLLVSGATPLGIGWFDAACGAFVGFFLALPGYITNRLGAGDVKLAGTCGFLIGLHGVLLTLLIAALVLGAMALSAIRQIGGPQSEMVELPAGSALCAGLGGAVVLLHLVVAW